MEIAMRPLLGVLFGMLGILVWIGGLVALSWFIENRIEGES